jgi:hypothetical protein
MDSMRTDVISMTKGSLTGALDLLSPMQPGRLAGSCYLVLDKPKQAQPILGSDGGAQPLEVPGPRARQPEPGAHLARQG